jgi:DNA-binding transcriptional regulator YiaG
MAKVLKKDNQGCLIAPKLTSEEIKRYRLELGMTQERFSGEFGIPLGTLRRWERGRNVPRSLTGLIRAFAQVSGRRRLRQARSS